MKPSKKKQAKTATELLRIGGSDTKVVQFMDYPDFSDPNGRHILAFNIANARLADGNNNEIYSGQIIVRVNTTLTPASLAIITRLLHPFAGYFEMIVNGSYVASGTYAEVYADDVPWTNIQPATKKLKSKVHIIPLE